MENLRFLHLTWDDVQGLTEEVARKIRASGFSPDVIVAVSRGGFDPARILCDQLDVRRLACVQVESYDGMSRTKEPVVVIPINTDLREKRVIVVDDVSDSGASLLKARDHALSKGALDARTATLHVKPWSKFRPDYFSRSADAWVVYPWELRETLLVVVGKLRSEGVEGSDLVDSLSALGFKREDIEKYLPKQDV
jgi:hypoxanthine phosphoribosyltransferase